MLGYSLKRELKKRKDPLTDEALLVINKLEKDIEILNERILRLQHDIDLPSLFKEIKTLKEEVQIRQEAVNAAALIIDELRKELNK